jgi:hypothetical protein
MRGRSDVLGVRSRSEPWREPGRWSRAPFDRDRCRSGRASWCRGRRGCSRDNRTRRSRARRGSTIGSRHGSLASFRRPIARGWPHGAQPPLKRRRCDGHAVLGQPCRDLSPRVSLRTHGMKLWGEHADRTPLARVRCASDGSLFDCLLKDGDLRQCDTAGLRVHRAVLSGARSPRRLNATAVAIPTLVRPPGPTSPRPRRDETVPWSWSDWGNGAGADQC